MLLTRSLIQLSADNVLLICSLSKAIRSSLCPHSSHIQLTHGCILVLLINAFPYVLWALQLPAVYDVKLARYGWLSGFELNYRIRRGILLWWNVGEDDQRPQKGSKEVLIFQYIKVTSSFHGFPSFCVMKGLCWLWKALWLWYCVQPQWDTYCTFF